MTDLANYGKISIRNLELSSASSIRDSTLSTNLKGRLRLEARNDDEDDFVAAELHESTKEFTFSHLTQVKGVAPSQSYKDGVNKDETDNNVELVEPSASSESEILRSKIYLPRLADPEGFGVGTPWDIQKNGSTNQNRITVENTTTGNCKMHFFNNYQCMAIYEPLITINTKFIYQEFELINKGSNSSDTAYTDVLAVAFGLITQSAYENTTDSSDWGNVFTTYKDGSIAIESILDATTQNNMSIKMENGVGGELFGKFLLINLKHQEMVILMLVVEMQVLFFLQLIGTKKD